MTTAHDARFQDLMSQLTAWQSEAFILDQAAEDLEKQVKRLRGMAKSAREEAAALEKKVRSLPKP